MNLKRFGKACDPDLLRRAKAGDWKAFETLVSRYEDLVYASILQLEMGEQVAQEVTLATFLAAVKEVNRLRTEACFLGGLLRIAARFAQAKRRELRAAQVTPPAGLAGPIEVPRGTRYPERFGPGRAGGARA
jgi:RNA polymerase sigma-70 factor, ECF subfamily